MFKTLLHDIHVLDAQILTYGSFGRGSGSILDYVACSGTAMELIECSLFENYSSYCTHSQDTGLRCGMCSNVEKQGLIQCSLHHESNIV